jgi:hypothetical protein
MNDFDDSCELLNKATKEMQELTARLRAATENLRALWSVKAIEPPEDGFSRACDHAGALLTFRETVGIAIGEASMCWSETPKGIFNSTRASAIVDRIVKFHEKTLAESLCKNCGEPLGGSCE